MKTYAPKTNVLAADVILEAAVREAMRLIRDGALLGAAHTMYRATLTADLILRDAS